MKQGEVNYYFQGMLASEMGVPLGILQTYVMPAWKTLHKVFISSSYPWYTSDAELTATEMGYHLFSIDVETEALQAPLPSNCEEHELKAAPTTLGTILEDYIVEPFKEFLNWVDSL